jgi:hypothetical protein
MNEHFEVPASYLKEGMHVLLIQAKGEDYTRLYGTIDMDGEAYRVREYGVEHAAPEKHYINLQFDHLLETYSKHYEGKSWLHPNDTVYMRDGWRFYVNQSHYDEIQTEIARDKMSLQEAKKDAKVTALQAKLAEARATIARVEKEIGELR